MFMTTNTSQISNKPVVKLNFFIWSITFFLLLQVYLSLLKAV